MVFGVNREIVSYYKELRLLGIKIMLSVSKGQVLSKVLTRGSTTFSIILIRLRFMLS